MFFFVCVVVDFAPRFFRCFRFCVFCCGDSACAALFFVVLSPFFSSACQVTNNLGPRHSRCCFSAFFSVWLLVFAVCFLLTNFACLGCCGGSACAALFFVVLSPFFSSACQVTNNLGPRHSRCCFSAFFSVWLLVFTVCFLLTNFACLGCCGGSACAALFFIVLSPFFSSPSQVTNNLGPHHVCCLFLTFFSVWLLSFCRVFFVPVFCLFGVLWWFCPCGFVFRSFVDATCCLG